MGEKRKQSIQEIKISNNKPQIPGIFRFNKPIILWIEVSFHEVPDYFRKDKEGISRSLIDTEKWYSQIEKDVLVAKWALAKLRNYIIVAPKFPITTAHKSLIPMFNKMAAKLSPHLKKWIMETTDLDLELKYEPSRNELDPLVYISRHPMPEYRTR